MMLGELIRNRILGAAILSWFIAQLIKLIIAWYNTGEMDFSKLTSAGGMPSSHSSFTMALAVGVGQVYGYDSALFAISAVFSFVVMYDATNVRLEAGKQAQVLNRLVENIQFNNNFIFKFDIKLKELLGHTPLQVLAGAILGIIVGIYSVPR
ncbi:hypothetical protein AN639_06975 [Candidatus Epulonipiscium fishelsonii]|uniref:Uncharacterized protein n=1 Tax=Candidatus Epulonipiscium fishelsonii TaxID=77094 RepID=A0ACC8XGS2_9FIRM|nr:hypothetical protein AN639_06975 [Epulopiscium sp. SCG-B05WGA-EpuloA1]ONI42760.1 hypothetical protein AN396_13250 [Epulopiscium sp. SCG-B11WGA-EpuloA1]